MKPCLAYFRVSTDEQADKGQSLDTQKELCREYAEANGYQIVGEYKDDGFSATSLNRPAIKELIARCQEDKLIQAVLVQDTSRWARSTLDHLSTKALLKKHGVQLISISQPGIDDSPEGNFIDVVMAGANTLQSQITGQKVSKVLDRKAQSGYWPGWAPLGYKNIDNPNPTSTLDSRIITPDSETSTLVKRMFEMYATGTFSIRELTNAVIRLGLKGKSGNNIQKSIVAHTLNNPIYHGIIPYKGNTYPGKHEAIISKELFDTCQMMMAEHNQYASRKRKHDMLLRGFLYCDECGSRYWGGPHKDKRYYYYFCKSCKGGTYVISDVLEKQIEEQFKHLKISHEYAVKVVAKAKEIVAGFRQATYDDRTALQNRKLSLEGKMRVAEDNLLDQALSKDQFKSLYDRLEGELASINSQIANLDQDYSEKIHSIEKLMALAENIGDAYKNADIHLKRAYIGLFFQRFTVSEGKIVTTTPSTALKPLLSDSSVRVGIKWLPSRYLTRNLEELLRNQIPEISRDFAINLY